MKNKQKLKKQICLSIRGIILFPYPPSSRNINLIFQIKRKKTTFHIFGIEELFKSLSGKSVPTFVRRNSQKNFILKGIWFSKVYYSHFK